MNPSQKSHQLRFFYWLLATIIFAYVVLRAIYVPILMDEVATFFLYVKNGRMDPWNSYLDANNHLLNSAMARICYLLFGEQAWALRIPNLIGFIFYAWFGYRILREIENPFAKITWIILIFCTQYFIEFFNICRGYGLSFGFLMGVFSCLVHQFKHGDIKSFCLGAVLNGLMIFANLALLSWSPILFAVSLLLVVIKKPTWKQYGWISLAAIIYLVGFIYQFNYASLLKAHDKFYLTGGHTFYDVIFFGLCSELGLSNFNMGKILVVPMLVLLPIVFIFNIRKMRWLEWTWLLAFISFNIGFILMHHVLKMNYPPNRSSIQIYLVLIVAYVIALNKNQIKWLNYISLIPLSFAVCFFIIHLNLSFNNHWKGEAIPHSFTKKVIELNKGQTVPYSVTTFILDGNTWNYNNYINDGKINLAKPQEIFDETSDLLVVSANRKNIVPPAGYDTIEYDQKSDHYLLMKKNISYRYNQVKVPNVFSSDEVIIFHRFNADSCYRSSIKIGVEFDLVESNILYESYLVVASKSEYSSYNLMMIREGKRCSMSASLKVKPGEEVNVYIWNIDRRKFVIENILVYIEQCE